MCNVIYIIFVALFSLILCTIIHRVDGRSLQVDRWSAMDVALKAMSEREYPYTAIDHLGGRTSNFPGLLLLAFPFYVIGNVGYFQVFAFVLFSFSLFLFFKVEKAFIALILLIASPSYWWEILALSDLMSNIIIVVSVILLCDKFFKEDKYRYPLFLGVLLAVISLTRGVVFIPLAIYYFRDFFYITITKKIIFICSLCSSFLFLVYFVLRDCPDIDTLLHFNPLLLQTTTTPLLLVLLTLILPLIVSFKVRLVNSLFFFFSFSIILVPVLYALVDSIYKFGWYSSIIESYFDISYLSMVLPFLICGMCQLKQENEYL